MSYLEKLKITFVVIVLGVFSLVPDTLWAADEYLKSAHGSSVARSVMVTANYATGNCAHCHEMHASLAGSEPLPDTDPGGAGPSAYTLFADNFNTSATGGPYLMSDNFCFYCHSFSSTLQTLTNADYSETFGGGSGGVQGIMDAMNQGGAYHNLGDIHTFMNDNSGDFPWYDTTYSNPCNACHNPHLAKKNYDDFSAPLSSALSKPSDHFNLWGESDTMATYSAANAGDYEAPYSNSGTEARESDGTVVAAGSDSSAQDSKTPDYVGFCTTCHNTNYSSITSTTLGTLRTIDWSSSGDKHGSLARDHVDQPTDTSFLAREPYATASSTNSNFLLSCLDCHEPHGSSSVTLIRNRANGEDLEGAVTSTEDMGNLCKRCHEDDSFYGGTAGRWRYSHHDEPNEAPYPGPPASCAGCHTTAWATTIAGSKPRIWCHLCHFHGSDDSWMDSVRSSVTTYRKTF